jgi:tungstate transport system substrate-binding protein
LSQYHCQAGGPLRLQTFSRVTKDAVASIFVPILGMYGRRALLTFAVTFALTTASSLRGDAQSAKSIILATTTSTQDTGLLDVLVPRFEQERGVEVKVIAVGTGAALRMAASGDADVVLVHAPAAEQRYVESGDLIDGRLVMSNDFVLVGPREDPAGIRGWTAIADVMRAIAARGMFISRGDESGTHAQELQLWVAAGIDPKSLRGREETGQGMGATVTIADQKRAYTLVDRGTYLALRQRLALVILFQGDASLRNIYRAYAVNPARHTKANRAEARAFIDFLVSDPIQRTIAAFKREEYGQSLFFPGALRASPR